MNSFIERIQANTKTLRQQIVEHKVYSAINDIDDLKIFMQYHVYAVWDFMSLLKALQNNLTCTSVPWFPKGSADTRYLINEIVVGEESDIDSAGNRISHFELYLQAMEQCGANTSQINSFLSTLRDTGDFEAAYMASNTPKEARSFVDFTFKTIQSNKDYLQAGIFTFGREDLIPGMFLSMVNDIDNRFPGNVSIFNYYLKRHIEVDGDHHSELAMAMMTNLCGTNEQLWQEAEQAIKESLEKRIELWNGAYGQIMKNRVMAPNAR